MHFDLKSLTDRPSALLRVPLFLALMLVVRGTPALLLYRKVLPRNQRVPLRLFSATACRSSSSSPHRDRRGQDPPENASALVAAGILSVLLFPALGLGRLRATRFAFVHEASTDEDASGSGSTDMPPPDALGAP